MNINALIRDWSWRVNDGMPDPKNRNHIELLESVLRAHKYSEEFIREYLKNITDGIPLNEGADTSATTLFHEVITGIFTVNPSAKIETGADVLSYFKDGTIKAVNAGLSALDIESLPQARYLNVDTIPKPKIISDAKSVASKLRSQFGQAKLVWWTGPTNDASKFGAADIVIDKKYGVSLKYGAGQLKNLTVNSFAQTVLGSSSDVNIMKDIMNTYSKDFDKMTKDWMALFVKEIGHSKNKDAIKLAKKLSSSAKTWTTYQKQKLTIKEVELLIDAANMKGINPGKIQKKGLRYLCKKLFELRKWPEWSKQRNVHFNKIFGGFFRGVEPEIKDGLGRLFKKQLSVQEYDLYYAAKGGKDFKYIPGEKSFDELTKDLQFSYAYKPSGSGYEFVLNIMNESGKQLGSISIKFRWKDGQMNGTIVSTSDAKWLVKDWSEIIPGAK
tara:strand:+ start:336 stop:1661 length:1326 start_codon:yes stop_codon:yes gene_type:complete